MATEVTDIEATVAGAPARWLRALSWVARSQAPATMVHILPTAADTPLTAEDTAMNIVRPVPTAPTVAMAVMAATMRGGATIPAGRSAPDFPEHALLVPGSSSRVLKAPTRPYIANMWTSPRIASQDRASSWECVPSRALPH